MSENLFAAGKLAEATAAQLAAVRDDPGNSGKRLHLFELAMFGGDLVRAQKQLTSTTFPDPAQNMGVAEYLLLIEGEAKRRAWLESGARPTLVGPEVPHVTARLEAWDLMRAGDVAGAEQALARADELSPTLKGTFNGTEFDGFRDADDRFGGVIEILVEGRWTWLPLELVATVTANAPAAPRDLYWVHIAMQLRTGQSGEAYMPALYPGTAAHIDEAIKLGRETDWKEWGESALTGLGRRMFRIGDGFQSALELRELVITDVDEVPEE